MRLPWARFMVRLLQNGSIRSATEKWSTNLRVMWRSMMRSWKQSWEVTVRYSLRTLSVPFKRSRMPLSEIPKTGSWWSRVQQEAVKLPWRFTGSPIFSTMTDRIWSLPIFWSCHQMECFPIIFPISFLNWEKRILRKWALIFLPISSLGIQFLTAKTAMMKLNAESVFRRKLLWHAIWWNWKTGWWILKMWNIRDL